MSSNVFWLGVGFAGQAMFSMRFLIQWLSTEKHRKSVIPVAFWHFSILGGAILLAYAIYRADPVFILGQAAGLLIYSRNLHFVLKERKARQASPETPRADPGYREAEPAAQPYTGTGTRS
ncbi:MAG: lipid-A-disaccharide synthase N-terminal domain-containing protein [Arenicellales bacterium]